MFGVRLMGTTPPKQLLPVAAHRRGDHGVHPPLDVHHEGGRAPKGIALGGIGGPAGRTAVYTEKLFDELAAEEKVKADRLAEAYRIPQNRTQVRI